MTILKHHLSLALFVAVLPTTAFAAQPGWYLAIDVGQARYPGIAGSEQQWMSVTPLPPEGMVITNSQASLHENESKDTGYRLTVGYQFNPYFGVEGGYVSLGNVHANGSGGLGMVAANRFLPLAAIGTFADTAKLRTHGWELAATGSWPLNPQWSLFGRIGVFDAHTKLDIASMPAPPAPGGLVAISVNESSSEWSPTFGVGVSFSPVNHWAVRLGWDRYMQLGNRNTTGRYNVNLLSLGVVYSL